MTDHNAINACAIASPAAWLWGLLPGAAPNGRGGWDVPAYDAGDGRGEGIEGVLAHFGADGSGWIGEKTFDAPVELVMLADPSRVMTRDGAVEWLAENLGLADERAQQDALDGAVAEPVAPETRNAAAG